MVQGSPHDSSDISTLDVDSSLDAVDAAAVRDRLEREGVLLLRGASPDVPAFRRLAERLCSTSVFNESPNRESVEADSNVQTVDLGADAFPLHPELSREPWRPDVAMFHCIVPPAGGGETTVCDGIGIVERLPADLVAEMAARRLLYIRRATPAELRFWLGTEFPSNQQLAEPPARCPYEFRAVRGMILRVFSRPLLHRPLFDQRLAFGNFLLFARDYLGRPNLPCLEDGSRVPDSWLDAVRAAAEPITIPIDWQAGDVALIDNSRVMHGRRAIPDPAHRRIASYFGYLRDAPVNSDEPADPVWRREEFRPPLALAD
jgi:alpha-ketoglutarate-dependent taurine dioxygenase